MARTIKRSSRPKRVDICVKYGKHKFDVYFKPYFSYKKRADGTRLETLWIRLHRTFVYGLLQMCENLLKNRGLKSLTWNYISDPDLHVLKVNCNNLLPLIRTHIGMMIREKGNEKNWGYSNLYLFDRIIKAKDCYENESGYVYYYGNVDWDSKKKIGNEIFLMKDADHEFKGEWVWED